MLEAETQRSSCGIDGRRFLRVIPACIRLSAFLEPMRTCEVASLEWIIVLKPTHEQRFRSLLSSSKAQTMRSSCSWISVCQDDYAYTSLSAMQIIRSSGVNLPAAASRASECAAVLPRSVASLSDLGADIADKEQWLNFRAALEAAGALEAEAGSVLLSGERLHGLQDCLNSFCQCICLSERLEVLSSL